VAVLRPADLPYLDTYLGHRNRRLPGF
jgi:hypothetical protein